MKLSKEWNLVRLEKFVFAWFVALALLPFLLLLYIYKMSVILVAKVFRPDLRPIDMIEALLAMDNLAEEDVVSHEYERKPVKNIGVFLRVNSEIDLHEFIQKVKKAWIDSNSRWSWKYKTYLVRFGGYGFFKETDKFDITKQIHKTKLKPGESVSELINEWILEKYAPRSPLWEFLLIDGDCDSKTPENYIALKLHHVIGDGFSLMEAMHAVLETENHPVVQKIFNHIPQYSFLEMVKISISAPLELFNFVLRKVKTDDPFEIAEGIEVEQFTSVYTMQLQPLKSLSKKYGVSITSILMSIYAGGIRRFLDETGRRIPNELFLPVSIPWPGRPKGFMGNRLGAMFAIVPLISNPVVRVQRVHDEVAEFYGNKMDLILRHVVPTLSSLIPHNYLVANFNKSKLRCLITPMLAADEYRIDGKPVKSISAIVGLHDSTFGLFTSTVSHKNEIVWTVAGAKALFKTQDHLDRFLQKHVVEDLQELLRLSGSSAAPPATHTILVTANKRSQKEHNKNV